MRRFLFEEDELQIEYKKGSPYYELIIKLMELVDNKGFQESNNPFFKVCKGIIFETRQGGKNNKLYENALALSKENVDILASMCSTQEGYLKFFSLNESDWVQYILSKDFFNNLSLDQVKYKSTILCLICNGNILQDGEKLTLETVTVVPKAENDNGKFHLQLGEKVGNQYEFYPCGSSLDAVNEQNMKTFYYLIGMFNKAVGADKDENGSTKPRTVILDNSSKLKQQNNLLQLSPQDKVKVIRKCNSGKLLTDRILSSSKMPDQLAYKIDQEQTLKFINDNLGMVSDILAASMYS